MSAMWLLSTTTEAAAAKRLSPGFVMKNIKFKVPEQRSILWERPGDILSATLILGVISSPDCLHGP